MYLGLASCDRRAYGGAENPESFSGWYLAKSYKNPTLRVKSRGVHRSSKTGCLILKYTPGVYLKEE